MGGIFVIRGGYHAPTEKEAHEVEAAPDEDAPPSEPGMTIAPAAK